MRRSLDHHLHLAVDDPHLVDGDRPGGGQRRAARRSRGRRRCRASSTRACARRRAPHPRTARCPGAAAVADGVDVVADAHERDHVAAGLDAVGLARPGARRAAPTSIARSSASTAVELGGDRRVELRAARSLATGTASNTSSKNPATISRSATVGGHAAALEVEALLLVDRARRPRRGCSGRRCSRSGGSAPTRPRRPRRA